jgi:hypothetical protein
MGRAGTILLVSPERSLVRQTMFASSRMPSRCRCAAISPRFGPPTFTNSLYSADLSAPSAFMEAALLPPGPISLGMRLKPSRRRKVELCSHTSRPSALPCLLMTCIWPSSIGPASNLPARATPLCSSGWQRVPQSPTAGRSFQPRARPQTRAASTTPPVGPAPQSAWNFTRSKPGTCLLGHRSAG